MLVAQAEQLQLHSTLFNMDTRCNYSFDIYVRLYRVTVRGLLNVMVYTEVCCHLGNCSGRWNCFLPAPVHVHVDLTRLISLSFMLNHPLYCKNE